MTAQSEARPGRRDAGAATPRWSRRSPAAAWSRCSSSRYLLRLLVQQEIQARYQGSVLGLLWSYVHPLVRFCMYFFVIGLILGLHKAVPNFAIHMFAGLIVRALLHRDLLRRHPLDRAQQGDRPEDGDAAGDVPGRLDARLGDRTRSRSC